MSVLRRVILLFVAMVASAASLLAQKQDGLQKSEVVVYYRHDKYSIDRTYMTNQEAFNTLDSIFLHYGNAIDSISIISHASPEGRHYYNMWLSKQRANSMKGFLRVKYPTVDFSNLKTYPRGEDFQGLVEMVEADKNVPYRKEVLAILNNNSLHADKRMEELYKLRGGVSYSYIKRQILPWLRTATTCIIYYNREAIEAQEVIAEAAKQEIIIDEREDGKASVLVPYVPEPAQPTFTPAQEEAPTEQPTEEVVEQPTEVVTPAPEEVVEQPVEEQQGERGKERDSSTIDYLVAAKTNLLFDAVGAVNVAAEIPIGNRYSVEGSWTFPWYVPEDWDWCYQLLWGDVSGRYWLGERTRENRLLGHFVGLYAGGGLYDFQWRSTDGYQGEFFLAAGVSYGYTMRMKNNWRFEFEFGLGYLRSNYRHYYHITEPDGKETLIRDRVTGVFGYWGPTRARISLVVPIEWSVER